jgi:hypothetical protein
MTSTVGNKKAPNRVKEMLPHIHMAAIKASAKAPVQSIGNKIPKSKP